jgi:hypothetical protein
MMMPKLMPVPKRLMHALFAITLLNVSIPGCAHVGFKQKLNAQSEGCKYCHAPDGEGDARDFSFIYNKPMSHHAVGASYPLGANSYPIFNLPTGQSGNVVFFDRNGNGKLDANEIRLYGTNISVTVECASCHMEHGGNRDSGYTRNNSYLRIPNVGSALCSTCHRQ